MNVEMFERAQRIPSDEKSPGMRPEIAITASAISFVIGESYLRLYTSTMKVLSAIVLLGGGLSYLIHFRLPIPIVVVLLLMFAVVAGNYISTARRQKAHRPLLTIEPSADKLTVYNFRHEGSSIGLSEIALFLEISYPSSAGHSGNMHADILAATTDGRLLFVSRNAGGMAYEWSHEAANMLGYIVGKSVRNMNFFGMHQTGEDVRGKMFTAFIENGRSVDDTANLAPVITPGARVDMEKLMVCSELLYEPPA